MNNSGENPGHSADVSHSQGRSWALLTDLYELTMAQGYWLEGLADRTAAFHLVFRKNPFDGGYAVACGLAQAVEYLCNFKFRPDDIAYLASLKGYNNTDLFRKDLLDFLGDFELRYSVHAVPEGTVVFPHEPLIRVTGPLLDCQIVESALLNAVGFQTLIATRAARLCHAAGGQPIIDFGLRRAQGPDSALAAARASYIGGLAATSNLLAGKMYSIPVKGTQAHSWIMAFDTELESFEAYARAMPNNCIFLVDTYNSLAGTRNAIEAAHQLEQHGGKLLGIRLDSGDLAYLSIEARRLLDDAGYKDAVIIGSGDLDEYVIESLKTQGAVIDAWGVGTRLMAGQNDPTLTSIYKLTAIQDSSGKWQPRIKLSERMDKMSMPGVLQVRRFTQDGLFAADAIFDEHLGMGPSSSVVDPLDPTRSKAIEPDWPYEDLLKPVIKEGRLIAELPPLEEISCHCREQLERLHPGIKRLLNPHQYPAGMEQRLYNCRTELIKKMRLGIASSEELRSEYCQRS